MRCIVLNTVQYCIDAMFVLHCSSALLVTTAKLHLFTLSGFTQEFVNYGYETVVTVHAMPCHVFYFVPLHSFSLFHFCPFAPLPFCTQAQLLKEKESDLADAMGTMRIKKLHQRHIHYALKVLKVLKVAIILYAGGRSGSDYRKMR